MRNRVKVMILIMMFWIILETSLLVVGFSPIPVLMFALLGIVIFNLIGMLLDIHNTKVNKWFDSTNFFNENK